jgi:hypothetical protein
MRETERADLAALSSLAPRRLNTFIHTGWIASVEAGRPVDARGEPIPWYTYPAIDFLESKIQREWSVLEWGCGNSTRWWAARTARVLSIEHNAEWQRKISTDLPAHATATLIEDPLAYSTLKETAPAETFDVLIIDGEERNACARTAVTRAKPSSIIVFDNSDRKSVGDGMTYLADSGWKRIDFFGLLPSYAYRTCTSIFFRDDSLLRGDRLPCDLQSSLGLTCAQVLGE